MSKPEIKIVEDRIFVTVALPLQSPKLSHSGKTMTIASTDGFVNTDESFRHEGQVKVIKVQVNVCIDKP